MLPDTAAAAAAAGLHFSNGICCSSPRRCQQGFHQQQQVQHASSCQVPTYSSFKQHEQRIWCCCADTAHDLQPASARPGQVSQQQHWHISCRHSRRLSAECWSTRLCRRSNITWVALMCLAAQHGASHRSFLTLSASTAHSKSSFQGAPHAPAFGNRGEAAVTTHEVACPGMTSANAELPVQAPECDREVTVACSDSSSGFITPSKQVLPRQYQARAFSSC